MLRALLRQLHQHCVHIFTDSLWLDLYAKFGFKHTDRLPHLMDKTRLVVRAPRFVELPIQTESTAGYTQGS